MYLNWRYNISFVGNKEWIYVLLIYSVILKMVIKKYKIRKFIFISLIKDIYCGGFY